MEYLDDYRPWILGTACKMQGGPAGQMDFRPKGTFCHNMWCGTMGWAIHPCMRQRQFYHLIFRIFPQRWIWKKWRWNDCYFALKSWAIHSLRDVFWFASSCAIQLSDGVSIVAYINTYHIISLSCMISIWFGMDLYGLICQCIACLSHIVNDPCLSMYDICVVSWRHNK